MPSLSAAFWLKLLIIITAYLFVTLTIGRVVGFAMKRVSTKENDEAFTELIAAGLKDAGKYIGWLERTLILTFILVNNYNGIGLVLATKGILRFGEIKEISHRKFSEYIILGTLLSFSLSFIVGLGLNYLLKMVEKG